MRKRIKSAIIKFSSDPKSIGKRKPAIINSGFSFSFKTQTKELIAPENKI